MTEEPQVHLSVPSGEARAELAVDLPALPYAVAHVHSSGEICGERMVESNGVWPVELVTLKQAHDYARAYAAAALSAREELVRELAEALTEVSEILDLAVGVFGLPLPADADGPAAKARAALSKAKSKE